MIPGLGRSPEEGKGYPLQYFGLENSMYCIVHGVAKSQTWLSDFHFLFFLLLDLGKVCEAQLHSLDMLNGITFEPTYLSDKIR